MPSSQSRILIIDDSQLTNQMLKDMLESAGYEVAQALDANQGYMMAIDFKPDLVLLDVHLPDIMGYELARVMRNKDEFKSVPIIMMTGTHHALAQKVQGFQSGADDYVLKPFENEELLERIKALLRRSMAAPPAEVDPVPVTVPVPVPAPVPVKAAPQPPSSPAPAAKKVNVQWSWPETLRRVLNQPWTITDLAACPNAGRPFIVVLLLLSVGAVAMAPGGPISPWVAGGIVLGLWSLVWGVLVMGTSLAGISLTAKEAVQLLSWACLPMLFKAGLGFIFSAVTTLSPALFTAGPALFWPNAPALVYRLDVFEVWSVFLLAIFLLKRPASSLRTTVVITGLAWLAVAIAATLLQAMGKST